MSQDTTPENAAKNIAEKTTEDSSANTPEDTVENTIEDTVENTVEDTQENEADTSLFARIGGTDAVDAAVEVFYRKVLDDYRINRFFDGADMEKQIAKQKAFFTMAFGGPNDYTGTDMRTAHAKLVKMGLDDSHFDAVMENLAATLNELGVPQDLAAEAATIAEGARANVLSQ